MRRFTTIGPGLVVLLAAVLTLFAAPSALKHAQLARIGSTVAIATATLDEGDALESVGREVRAVANAVMPSVAHIEAPRGSGFGSSGSGWVFDEDGHIVTNAHVVGSADRVTVELYDGRVLSAEVIGRDRQTDIAVLRVDVGPGVFPIRRASGQPLHIGDPVFAFGSPFGIKFSMSEGIVSGLGRSEAASFLDMIGGYTNFIQTDAAMNPGNSGGPLVDADGRLVGMNAAIANNFPDRVRRPMQRELERVDPDTRRLFERLIEEIVSRPQGQSAGIGFAIPLETVEAVVAQLLESEVVLRGYMGVGLPPFDLDAGAAARLGFSGQGVLLASVIRGEPAGKAGLRQGDIILSIDGVPTITNDVLRSIVSVRRPGRSVEVQYWRDGETRETMLRLGAAYNPGGLRGLQYVPGSEDMTIDEIRRRIAGTDESRG